MSHETIYDIREFLKKEYLTNADEDWILKQTVLPKPIFCPPEQIERYLEKKRDNLLNEMN